MNSRIGEQLPRIKSNDNCVCVEYINLSRISAWAFAELVWLFPPKLSANEERYSSFAELLFVVGYTCAVDFDRQLPNTKSG